MNSPKSRSQFFPPNAAASGRWPYLLPTRLSNTVQHGTALLALDPETFEITGHSANAPAIFAVPDGALLGRDLGDINPHLALALAAIPQQATPAHEVLDVRILHEGQTFDTITHQHNGTLYVELLPAPGDTPARQRRKMRLGSATCGKILQAADLSDALDLTVTAVREITGYARAQIYRFLPDRSGQVIAEDCEAHMPPHLGLYFPATDVPRQLRDALPCRATGNLDRPCVEIVTKDPQAYGDGIDLTWAVSRSVSRAQSGVLRKLGIRASVSCRLMHRGHLWGLIAAHDTSGGLIPYNDWLLLQELGAALMLRQEQEARAKSTKNAARLRGVEKAFAKTLRRNGDPEEVMPPLLSGLSSFLDAPGFALQYGNALHLSGATPPRAVVENMLAWAADRAATPARFETTQLHHLWVGATDHKATACGVLIEPISVQPPCQLVWFRGPAAEATLQGDTSTDEMGHPRAFNRWSREHRGQSMPWQTSDLDDARDTLADFLDAIGAQLHLSKENRSLRQFAESAAHDLKAPLRGISVALDVMQDEGFDATVVQQTHALARRSAERLTVLTNGLLELAVIGEEKPRFAQTDLNHVLRDARDMLQAQRQETGAEITLEPLPSAPLNDRLMLRLFLNLLGNALKYRHPDRPPRVSVTLAGQTDHHIDIAVTDNGLGVPPESAARIFKPLERLHSQDQIEGSGLGLAICTRIAALHRGSLTLDPHHGPGARFVLRLDKTLDTA